MRITVYQWTSANGRTKYSWYLNDTTKHKDAETLAEMIANNGEDIVDVTLDVDGTVTYSVDGKYLTF
jgi:hypothetical protein